MADRVTGQTATLRIDLPGFTDESVTVTVTDPFGTVRIGSAAATGNGNGRYIYTTTETLDRPGSWTATWSHDGSVVTTQTFTVGPPISYARTLYDLRIDVARRVVSVHEGFVQDGSEEGVSDPTLYGSAGEYGGFWLVPDPQGPDSGRAFLVEGFNGSALKLTSPFWEVPLEGSRYVLMDAHPREVDRALQVAIQDLGHLSRIPVTLTDLALDGNLADVPDFLTHVTDVWVDGTKVTQTGWEPRPGRQLFVESSAGTITVTGLSSATVPLWEDSRVDIGPAALIAKAAMQLHANRAGSSTVDLEEHLRRQLAADAEYETAKRSEIGRIPPGARRVIE